MKSKHERSVKANMLRAGRQGEARGPFIEPHLDPGRVTEALLKTMLFVLFDSTGN
jgi:hypothetical protein